MRVGMRGDIRENILRMGLGIGGNIMRVWVGGDIREKLLL
jgi:hypothetical protein